MGRMKNVALLSHLNYSPTLRCHPTAQRRAFPAAPVEQVQVGQSGPLSGVMLPAGRSRLVTRSSNLPIVTGGLREATRADAPGEMSIEI